MDRDAEKMCPLCHAYQVVRPPAPPPLVKTTPLPNGPWGQLAADLLGPLPGGEYVIGAGLEKSGRIVAFCDWNARFATSKLCTVATLRLKPKDQAHHCDQMNILRDQILKNKN